MPWNSLPLARHKSSSLSINARAATRRLACTAKGALAMMRSASFFRFWHDLIYGDHIIDHTQFVGSARR